MALQALILSASSPLQILRHIALHQLCFSSPLHLPDFISSSVRSMTVLKALVLAADLSRRPWLQTTLS